MGGSVTLRRMPTIKFAPDAIYGPVGTPKQVQGTQHAGTADRPASSVSLGTNSSRWEHKGG